MLEFYKQQNINSVDEWCRNNGLAANTSKLQTFAITKSRYALKRFVSTP